MQLHVLLMVTFSVLLLASFYSSSSALLHCLIGFVLILTVSISSYFYLLVIFLHSCNGCFNTTSVFSSGPQVSCSMVALLITVNLKYFPRHLGIVPLCITLCSSKDVFSVLTL